MVSLKVSVCQTGIYPCNEHDEVAAGFGFLFLLLTRISRILWWQLALCANGEPCGNSGPEVDIGPDMKPNLLFIYV